MSFGVLKTMQISFTGEVPTGFTLSHGCGVQRVCVLL